MDFYEFVLYTILSVICGVGLGTFLTVCLLSYYSGLDMASHTFDGLSGVLIGVLVGLKIGAFFEMSLLLYHDMRLGYVEYYDDDVPVEEQDKQEGILEAPVEA